MRSDSVHSQMIRRKFRPGLELMEDRLTPSTLVVEVTSTVDSNDPKSGALRAAITVCNNSDPGFEGRLIEIMKAGEYVLELDGPDEDSNATGDLDLLQDINILNESKGTVTIDAGGLKHPDRVFDIGPNGAALRVEIDGVSIQNGSAPAGGAIRVPSASDLKLENDILRNNTAGGGGGGAVFMLDGNLSITGTRIEANTSGGSGGGVFQAGNGALTISDSSFDVNKSQGGSGQGGGGVRYDGTGDVRIFDTEFELNTAVGDGGGLWNTNNAAVTIQSSTFQLNRSNGDGGGLFLGTGVASALMNNTISDNVAVGSGGGLAVMGKGGAVITVQNDTIAFNTAGNAGGVVAANTSVRLINTIIAQNLAASTGNPDVDSVSSSNMVDVANNFIGNNFGAEQGFIASAPNASGSFVGTASAPLDPLLGPTDFTNIGENASLVTYSNLPNSGNNGVRDRGRDGATPTTDERGFSRISGAHTDIGAFEFQYPDMAITASSPGGSIQAGSPVSLSFVVTNNDTKNASSGVVLSVALPSGTTVNSASSGFTVSGNVVSLAVADLAAQAKSTITVTVTPNAAGAFTANATLGIDPDLTNNSAAVSFTVTPAPFPAKGSADVTSMVQVVLLGRRRAAKRQTISITNTSGTPIQGPVGVLPVLSGGVKLKNASGQLAKKQKFVRASVGADKILSPGESVSVQLVFSKAFLPRRFKVMAGAFG